MATAKYHCRMQSALDQLNQEFPAGMAEACSALLDELERSNRRVNLTAIRERNTMITGHILDSLVARPLLSGETILDVGTGAGFPGLPLAIAEPRRRFALIDGNNKKVQFVQHMVRRLDLGNVTAVQVRAEDYAPGHRFDTVIARAVAAVPRLIDMAGHHVGEDGVFLALKGRRPDQELQSIPAGWEHEVLPLNVPGIDAGARHAVVLRRS